MLGNCYCRILEMLNVPSANYQYPYPRNLLVLDTPKCFCYYHTTSIILSLSLIMMQLFRPLRDFVHCGSFLVSNILSLRDNWNVPDLLISIPKI